MAVRIKAYLYSDKQVSEVRYFSVQQKVSTSYEHWVNKVRQIFTSLQDKEFRLFWKDAVGDLISFSSDEELSEALDLSSDGVFKLLITVTSNNTTGKSNDAVLHPGVICDGCDSRITGTRFKCLQCSDYDLCSRCDARGMHNQHDMARIHHPRQPFTTSVKNPWGWSRGHRFQGRCPIIFLGPVADGEQKPFHDEGKDEDKTEEGEKKERAEEFDIEECAKTVREVLDSAFQAFMGHGPEAKEGQNVPNKKEGQLKEQPDNDSDLRASVDGAPNQKDRNVEKPTGAPSEIFKEGRKDVDGDFVVVDKNEESVAESSLTTERKDIPIDHNQTRLDEALSLMEGMGFQDEDGWLSSLIVAKDYDVGRVVNTIIPQGRLH